MYCERQCALVHVEQVWVENRLTTEGRLLHEQADHGIGESRGDLRIVRGLRLHSRRLGLSGRADVVEIRRLERSPGWSEGAQVPGQPGRWSVRPVEYKRGRPKSSRCDHVQLCAQALCLEEMLETSIDEGDLYYGKKRRRQRVHFDSSLRDRTEAAARRLHEVFASGRTPGPEYDEKKCGRCSLLQVCLPTAPARSALRYVELAMRPEPTHLPKGLV